MQIVKKNLDHLTPYVNNARVHPDSQIAQIAASLVEFGWTSPILIHNGSVVAGHGRLMAAKRLRDAGTIIPRWENNKEAPTIDLSSLSDTQRKAYILADNRIALNSTWDNDLLSTEMGALYEDDFDLSKIGFNPGEIATLFGIELEDPEKAWDGMPEFEHEDQNSKHKVIVHFASTEDMNAFAELVEQTITEKTRSIWYPKAEIGHYADKRYAVDDDGPVDAREAVE
jgi:ParB family transcriptional regulator, chromosome partitioning protein